MYRGLRAPWIALLLLVVHALPATAQEVDLRWKYDEGEALVYRMTTRQVSATPQGTMDMELVQTVRWTVDEVTDEGVATVTVTTERVQVDQSSPTGSFQYDSETTPDPASGEAALFGALVDMSYTLTIEPDGTVRDVLGLESMVDRMTEGLPDEQRPMARNMFAQMFSPESIRSMMQQSVQTLPQEGVALGASWETSSSVPIPMMGEMKAVTRFTLEDVEERAGHDVAVITSTGTMTMSPAGGAAGAAVSLEDATSSGRLEFDLERGHVLTGTTEASMTMRLEMGGRAMTMENTTISEIELVEHLPGTPSRSP